MSSTITPVVSPSQAKAQLSSWAKFGAVAAILAFCPALLPLASAGCRGGMQAGAQAVPSVPGMFTAPAGASQSANSSASKTPVSIVGLWNLNFLADGTIVDVAFDAWHSDGTEVLNDYTNPINGNVCLGVWEQTGPRTYKLKHPSWYFDGTGNLLGTVVIHEVVRLSPDGDSFSGTYTYDIYDVSGNFLEELSGQLQATRIKVD
jgi:hypothetical protein